MSNALAEPLFERLHDSYPADQDYTRDDWSSATMPGTVRHYLTHLLQQHSRREARRLRRARTQWIDYDHPDMEAAVRQFFDAVEQHTRIPKAEWTDTLRTTARRVTDHLIRPVPTLRSFVYDDASEALAVSKIRWRMEFFRPYSYLRETVQAFCEKRNRDALDAREFERLLRRVDERMTADYGAERWMQLLEPLFATATFATDDDRIPVSSLEAFFAEKNAEAVTDRLAAYERDHEDATIDRATVRDLLSAERSSTQGTSTDAGANASVAEFYGSDSAKGDIEDVADQMRKQEADRSATAETPEHTPLWKRFKHGRPRRKTKTEHQEDRDRQPLWTQFEHGETPPEPPSRPKGPKEGSGSTTRPDETSDLADVEGDVAALEREVLGAPQPSHRKVYVEKLFAGDADAYRRILERLREVDSWKRASQIIAGDVFRANEVNIYSDAAVHFTNAVESAFQD